MDAKSAGGGGNIAPFSQESFPWKKAASAVYTPGTHILCPTAGYILAYSITTNGTGPAILTFYDGHNAVGREVWVTQSIAKDGRELAFKTPIYCDRGITIVVGANCTKVAVQWIPGPRM